MTRFRRHQPDRALAVADKLSAKVGRFIVFAHPHGDDKAQDIMFQLAPDMTGLMPKDQSNLKGEAEKTLFVLRTLCATEENRFRPYFKELLGLCQYGLVGQTAQPIQALDSLQILQEQIFDNEKGRAISTYMHSLAKSQAIGVILALFIVAAGLISVDQIYGTSFLKEKYSALAIAPGLFVGVVFSSFMRCRAIGFYDLHAIDADRFTPALKTLFAFVIVLLAAAFLKAGIFEIKIGKAELADFDNNVLSAFVFGAVVGVAQEAIISRIETIKQKVAPSRSSKKKSK
jgi:hypothetical protein